MAWIRSGRAAVAVAVAAIGVPACMSPHYDCPCGLFPASVAVPSAQTTTIDSIQTDPPCTAMEGGAGSGIVEVYRQGSGSCQVRVDLGNGDTYAFSVQFRTSGGACCGDDAFPVDASFPVLVDAGAG